MKIKTPLLLIITLGLGIGLGNFYSTIIAEKEKPRLSTGYGTKLLIQAFSEYAKCEVASIHAPSNKQEDMRIVLNMLMANIDAIINLTGLEVNDKAHSLNIFYASTQEALEKSAHISNLSLDQVLAHLASKCIKENLGTPYPPEKFDGY